MPKLTSRIILWSLTLLLLGGVHALAQNNPHAAHTHQNANNSKTPASSVGRPGVVKVDQRVFGNQNPAPFSGFWSHHSNIAPDLHQHFFSGATNTLTINAGDSLFAYVLLDQFLPTQLMLQWNENGSWEHRAYWAAAPSSTGIPWGVEGQPSRFYAGPLPPAGQWVRLQVPAASVGLVGKTINGMAFTLFGGRANWDHVGKISQP